MPGEYDIFERTAAGYLIWRDVVCGYDNATKRLSELGSQSDNEHFLFHLASKQVVARVNESFDRGDSHPIDEAAVLHSIGRNNRSAA
jgi:hypothetical protein